MSITLNPSDALLVVDVQNDFCPNGALAVAGGDEIIPIINALMPRFDHVILTQDYHPKGHISFASTHQKPLYSKITVSYGEQVMWPEHCIQGTSGADLHNDLDSHLAKLILRKGTQSHLDSYSAFLEADGETVTGLGGFLREIGVTRVFIAGLATDFCVAWTAMDAKFFGFETYVIDDACRGIDVNGSLADAWRQMGVLGIEKITSNQLGNP